MNVITASMLIPTCSNPSPRLERTNYKAGGCCASETEIKSMPTRHRNGVPLLHIPKYWLLRRRRARTTEIPPHHIYPCAERQQVINQCDTMQRVGAIQDGERQTST